MDNMLVDVNDVTKDIKLRNLTCEMNPLTRSDGSVSFGHGGTCVLASTLGPFEVKLQNLKIDKAYIDCIYRPNAGVPSISDRMREAFVKDACEAAILTALHPRTMISIQIQELDNQGGMDACAVNAACMALLIGGIPMKFTIAAVCCILDKDGELILDPDYWQTMDNQASFTFVFDSLNRDIVTVHNRGCFKMAHFNEAYLMSRAASSIIFDYYRQILTDFHSKSKHQHQHKSRNQDQLQMQVQDQSQIKTETIENYGQQHKPLRDDNSHNSDAMEE